MFYPPVGMSAYEGTTLGLGGFGSGALDNVQQLNKALSAGYGYSLSEKVGGSSLRVESLEESLKILTYSARHFKFWPKLYKSPAYNTIEEYNQLISYGDDGFGPFLKEGELALANDSQFQRRSQLLKYMGTAREITHPMSMVHPAHGDLIALENQNGILWLLRQIEIFLFKGNSKLAFSGEGEQWDGLDNLIESDMYIDLEGAPTQEADYEECSNLLAENFAYPTDIFLGYRPMSDLVKTMYPRHRVQLPAPAEGKIGQTVESMITQGGLLEFNVDRFIERAPIAVTTTRGVSTMVPTTPASIAAAPGSSTIGEFDKSQGSQDAKYAYVVTAANRFGESAPSAPVLTAALSGVNAQDGHVINLTITNAASVTVAPEYFNVYRTVALKTTVSSAPTVASKSYSLVAQIPAQSQSGSGVTPTTGTIPDKNRIMPFTEQIYIGEMTPQVLTFRQLAPMMKMDLAVLAPAYRWLILMYGCLVLFAPRKWARLLNVGRLGRT